VNALAVSAGTLYATGFEEGLGNPGGSIAQWNGSSWSALGSAMNSNVYALAVSGGTLYAGGAFTYAGSKIAQWNGTNWSALGSGMDQPVYALAVSGSTLYAGGVFGTAGGSPANYIAQWDGTNWSAMGSGMAAANPYYSGVYALAPSGGMLYAGGGFSTAGGRVSADVSGAVISPVPVLVQPHFTNHQFQFTVNGPMGSNAVIYANTNLPSAPWVPLATNGLGVGSLTFTDLMATNSSRFYRAQLTP
jgi:hypothetical protein